VVVGETPDELRVTAPNDWPFDANSLLEITAVPPNVIGVEPKLKLVPVGAVNGVPPLLLTVHNPVPPFTVGDEVAEASRNAPLIVTVLLLALQSSVPVNAVAVMPALVRLVFTVTVPPAELASNVSLFVEIGAATLPVPPVVDAQFAALVAVHCPPATVPPLT